jgi:hypothetical protein
LDGPAGAKGSGSSRDGSSGAESAGAPKTAPSSVAQERAALGHPRSE